MTAKKLTLYYFIYKEHLSVNNLADDSDTILVDDLIDFVENEIGDEDRSNYEYFAILKV